VQFWCSLSYHGDSVLALFTCTIVLYEVLTLHTSGVTVVAVVTVVQTPVNWRTGSVKSNEIKLVLSSGQTWLLFFSEAVSFTYDISTMTMDAPFTGVLRAAILSEPKVMYMQLVRYCIYLQHVSSVISHSIHRCTELPCKCAAAISVVISKHVSFIRLHIAPRASA
jgi:hypothetical protein